MYISNLFGIIKNAFRALWLLIFPNIDTARDIRKGLTQNYLQIKKFSPDDITARKQYWYGHALFLAKFLSARSVYEQLNSCGIYYDYADTQTPAGIIKIITLLLASEQGVRVLLIEGFHNQMRDLIEKPVIEARVSSDRKEIFSNDDAIRVINETIALGFVPVVNNAANSNRDGSAKYQRGTLEELLDRHTGAGCTMPLHFRDVDGSNQRQGAHSINVEDYHIRYMKWFLTILSKVLNDPNYVETQEFIEDICGCGRAPYCNDPIYFDLQNVVYEVLPLQGFSAHCIFFDPTSLTSPEAFTAALTREQPKIGREICIINSAAPDRRTTSFLDRYATSDPDLQNSGNNLKDMIEGVISYQCSEARRLKEAGKPACVIFILPGCGAFGNPLEETARIFLEKIKSEVPILRDNGISFCIVERNQRIYSRLIGIGKEIQLIDENGVLMPIPGFYAECTKPHRFPDEAVYRGDLEETREEAEEDLKFHEEQDHEGKHVGEIKVGFP